MKRMNELFRYLTDDLKIIKTYVQQFIDFSFFGFVWSGLRYLSFRNSAR